MAIPNDIALIGIGGGGKSSIMALLTRTFSRISENETNTMQPIQGTIKFMEGKTY